MSDSKFKDLENELYDISMKLHNSILNKKEIEEIKETLNRYLEEYSAEYLETDTQLNLNFKDVVDFILFIDKYKEEEEVQKTVVWVDFPIFCIYNILEYIAFEENNLEDLRYYLSKALDYAPRQYNMLFELSEYYKYNKDFETFKKKTLDIYKFIYKAEDMARYYRNLSFYYSEIKKYEVAYACMFISIVFEDTPIAYQELDYIVEKGKLKKKYKWKKIFDILESEGLPITPPEENIREIENIYETYEGLKNKEEVDKSFRERLFGLTQNEAYLLN